MSGQQSNGHTPGVKEVALEAVDPVDMFLAGILSLLRMVKDSNLSHEERWRVAQAAEAITLVMEGMDSRTAQGWNVGMVQILLDAAAEDKEDGPRSK